jgi:hypothetical protein
MIRSLSPRTMTRTAAAGAVVAAVLVIAGCGSSTQNPSGPAASAASANSLSSESPAQIVAAAQAALRSARGFDLTGTLTQGAEKTRLRMAIAGRKLDMSVAESGRTFQIIALPGASYVIANRAFWVAQSGPSYARLANHWFEVPASTTKTLSSSLGSLAPSTLARCLGEDLGTLSKAGTTTVDGHQALVIRDAGNMPGDAPGTLAVATSGPAYPLRLTVTGPTRPGGKVDACNDGKGDSDVGAVTLNDFDHVPAIIAPKHPIRAGATQSTSA